jgi:hypothetical protein
VPSGIIVISVITVGDAVQIKHSCLSRASTSITCRGYPDTRQVGVRITVNIVQYITRLYFNDAISVRRFVLTAHCSEMMVNITRLHGVTYQGNSNLHCNESHFILMMFLLHHYSL